MSSRIVILGLGNILCGDDAFGVQTAEKLHREYIFKPDVQIVDGGAQGATLYTFVERADMLIILDAVDFDMPPGSIVRREWRKGTCVPANGEADLPAWLAMRKLSAHQESFAELLALAELKNSLPEIIVLFGFQPASIEFGHKLSPRGLRAAHQTVAGCLDFLRENGIEAQRAERGESLVGPEVLKGGYVI